MTRAADSTRRAWAWMARARAALEGPKPIGPVTYVLVRRLWILLLGAIFFIAFATLWPQAHGLIGSRGIIPAERLITAAREHEGGFRSFILFPSLLHLVCNDAAISLIVLAGMAGSVALMMGRAPRAILALLWALYLSLCAVGAEFLNYQWDILLLEAAFLTIFWAPPGLRPHRDGEPAPRAPPLFLLRFLLFRLMFLGGLVKVIDPNGPWVSLTALDHHYATAPYPTAIAYYLHHLPHGIHAATAIATLGIELLAPLFFFGPRRARLAAAAATVSLQVMITLTGSFAFFNLLTSALCLTLLDDQVLLALAPKRLALGLARRTRAKDVEPSSPEQIAFALCLWLLAMNTISGLVIRVAKRGDDLPGPLSTVLTYTERFRTFNVYGLFEGVATERFDLVFLGSRDGVTWERYERRFGIEPTDLAPRPIAPFDPRVEFQLWTAGQGQCQDNPWMVFLQQRLLEGSPDVTSIFADGPFTRQPPTYIQVIRRSVTFTTPEERKRTGAWWSVGRSEPYCPPFQLDGGRLSAAPIPPALQTAMPAVPPDGLSPEDVRAVDQAFAKLERVERVSSVDAAREALKLLEPVYMRNPSDLRTMFLLARAVELTGDLDRAEKLYVQTADAASQAGSPEREYFAALYLGRLLSSRGKSDAAIASFRRATAVAEKGKKAITNGAIPECIGTRSYEASLELGRALWKAGQRADAERAFDGVLRLAPDRAKDIEEAKR